MEGILQITALLSSTLGGSLLVWAGYQRKVDAIERQELRASLELQLSDLRKELDAVAAKAMSLQGELHSCFGYVSKDGVLVFFNLTDVLSNGNTAVSRLQQLIAANSARSMAAAEQVFLGGELHLRMPRNGTKSGGSAASFALHRWRKQVNELIRAAEEIIKEAHAAQKVFHEREGRLQAQRQMMGLDEPGGINDAEASLPFSASGRHESIGTRVREQIAAEPQEVAGGKRKMLFVPAHPKSADEVRALRHAGVFCIEEALATAAERKRQEEVKAEVSKEKLLTAPIVTIDESPAIEDEDTLPKQPPVKEQPVKQELVKQSAATPLRFVTKKIRRATPASNIRYTSKKISTLAKAA